MVTKLYFDGAFKGSQATCGFIIDGLIWVEKTYQVSGTSPTEAEYQGLIKGLEKAIQMGVSTIEVIGDSQPVINQISGRSKTRARELITLKDKALSLLDLIPDYRVKWVPSDENVADAVSR